MQRKIKTILLCLTFTSLGIVIESNGRNEVSPNTRNGLLALSADYLMNNNNNKFSTTDLPGRNKILNDEYSKPLNYCSFFNNRAPSPQINLKNCTWYKENSCCLQAEIESTFSKVKIYK